MTSAQNRRRFATPARLALVSGSLLALSAAANAGDDQFSLGVGVSLTDTAYADPTVVGEPLESFTLTRADYLGAWDHSGSSFSLSFTTFSPAYCAPVIIEPVYCAPVHFPVYPVHSYTYYGYPSYSYCPPPIYIYPVYRPYFAWYDYCGPVWGGWRSSYSSYSSGFSFGFSFGSGRWGWWDDDCRDGSRGYRRGWGGGYGHGYGYDNDRYSYGRTSIRDNVFNGPTIINSPGAVINYSESSSTRVTTLPPALTPPVGLGSEQAGFGPLPQGGVASGESSRGRGASPTIRGRSPSAARTLRDNEESAPVVLPRAVSFGPDPAPILTTNDPVVTGPGPALRGKPSASIITRDQPGTIAGLPSSDPVVVGPTPLKGSGKPSAQIISGPGIPGAAPSLDGHDQRRDQLVSATRRPTPRERRAIEEQIIPEQQLNKPSPVPAAAPVIGQRPSREAFGDRATTPRLNRPTPSGGVTPGLPSTNVNSRPGVQPANPGVVGGKGSSNPVIGGTRPALGDPSSVSIGGVTGGSGGVSPSGPQTGASLGGVNPQPTPRPTPRRQGGVEPGVRSPDAMSIGGVNGGQGGIRPDNMRIGGVQPKLPSPPKDWGRTQPKVQLDTPTGALDVKRNMGGGGSPSVYSRPVPQENFAPAPRREIDQTMRSRDRRTPMPTFQPPPAPTQNFDPQPRMAPRPSPSGGNIGSRMPSVREPAPAPQPQAMPAPQQQPQGQRSAPAPRRPTPKRDL